MALCPGSQTVMCEPIQGRTSANAVSRVEAR